MAILEKTTSAEVIKAIFPKLQAHSLRTDSGPRFVSDEFETFLTTNGIKNHKTTLLWPQANTEVEAQNRLLHEWYQATTPYFMLFNWEMKSKLQVTREEVRDRD